MSGLYRLSKIGTRLLFKIRHHKGHGIHSPFVFDLINKVIEEKLPYYAYEDVEGFFSQFSKNNITLKKEHLLAFRLVNYFGAKHILELGVGQGVNTLCLTSPSSEIDCWAIEENKANFNKAASLYRKFDRNITLRNTLAELAHSQYDCIYINLDDCNSITKETLTSLVGMCHQKSFIVVNGIRNNRKQYRLWRCLTENEDRTAELDLFDTGLLFFDKQLYRWKYQISF